MPKKLPGGFILEDDDAVSSAPAAVAPAPSAAPAPAPGGFVLEDEPPAPPYTVTQGEWQGPPPPPENPLNVAGRGAYGAVTGAAAGILGMPGNLIQGMPWGHSWERTPQELPPGVHGPPVLGPPKYTPHYVNPLPTSQTVQKGIDWLMEKTGVYTPPVPDTAEATAERMGKTFGEVVAPSKAIPGFSVGKLQDIWVGIQSIVGEEATRMLSEGATPEDLERNGKIGAGVAPMLWALGYGLISRGLQRSGRIHLPKQVELPAAEKKLGEARTGLETTTEDYATRLADLQEKNRVQQAGAEAQIVPLTAGQEAEKARVAALEGQTAQATAQAEARAKFATRTAEEQAGIAKSEVQTPAQLEAEALKPLTPQVEALQPTPGVREPGADIQQAIVRQADADTAARQAGHTALADKWKNEIGPQLTDAAVLDMTKADVRPAVAKYRAAAGKAFDDVEQAFMNPVTKKSQKVVEAPGMRKALGRLVSEAEASGGSVAQEYLDLAELGLSPAQKATLKSSGMDRAKQALKLVPEEKLEFSVFRDVEEKLYAAGGGKPLGTLTQAPPRYLKRAVQEDMQNFFATDEGTGAGPAMQLAKAGWNKFLTEGDRGIITQLTDQRAGYQAQNFLKFLKNTSRQQIPELEAVLRNVTPETQAAISAHVAADMVRNATDTVTGMIKPLVMKQQLQRLEKNGTFGVLFDETQQKQLRDAVHEMTGKDTSILPKFRKALEGKDPEDVARFIFEPGKVTRTEQFQTIAPDKFPLARQAWARQFLQDYETGGSAAVQKQLTQMLREDNGVSQLSIMFPEHEFPGYVDKFKAIHAELRSAPERAAVTSERSQRMAEGATETQRIGKESVALTEDAVERLLVPARERRDAAIQAEKDARDAFTAMKRSGTAEEGQLKTEKAMELRRLSTEKKVAEQALHEVEAKVAAYKPGAARRLSRYIVGSGGTGLFAFLYGMTHTTPWAPYLLASGVIAGGITAAEASSFAMSRWARTQTGQRFMRDGLKQHYGAGAARWVNDVFLKSSAPTEGEPTNAPTP